MPPEEKLATNQQLDKVSAILTTAGALALRLIARDTPIDAAFAIAQQLEDERLVTLNQHGALRFKTSTPEQVDRLLALGVGRHIELDANPGGSMHRADLRTKILADRLRRESATEVPDEIPPPLPQSARDADKFANVDRRTAALAARIRSGQ